MKNYQNKRTSFEPSNELSADTCAAFFAEIVKIRGSLFQISGNTKQPLELPEATGNVVSLTEKVYVPVREHPDVSTH